MTAVRVLLALLTAVAAGVLALAIPAPARAAEPEALVAITLTSMTPALPERDGTISLTGRVTNVSGSPVSNLQAILWRASDPLDTPESLDRALASAADDPFGRRLFRRDYQNIPSETDRTLAPGASTDFSLTTDVAALDLPRAEGVYLFGVHVRGRTVDDPQRDQTLGRARTFLPLVDRPPENPLQLTTLVVLSSRPAQLRPGVLVDDHLSDEVAPGGRLFGLLGAADSDDTSFAVDPELVEELTTMRDGYTVQAADGATVPGRGQAEAAAWLQRFSRVVDERDGYRLLYGSPDIAALVHDRQQALLADAVDSGRRVGATAALPLLVLPGGGLADEATVAAAEQLHPAAIVLSDASAPGDGPLLAGLGTAPIVRYSSSSNGGGPGPDPRTTPVQVRQRALAETWVAAATPASGTPQGRVRLVTSSNQLSGDDPGLQAPWLTRSTLSELLEGIPAGWNQTYVYPESARAAELGPDQLGSLRTLARSSATYADLLVDPGDAQARGQAAVARAASVAWRQQDGARRRFLAPQRSALEETVGRGLQISSNPKVSTVAREGVVFPITIKNGLPDDPSDPDVNAVKVKLVFVSENPQRLTIAPINAGLIRAQDNFTANAQVTARANGTVRVRAQLLTLAGSPVGRPQTIDVRVTQNGTTGWAIAGAALILFVGSTSLRIRRVGRARALAAATAAAAAPAPVPSALTSAPPTDAPAPDAPERFDA